MVKPSIFISDIAKSIKNFIIYICFFVAILASSYLIFWIKCVGSGYSLFGKSENFHFSSSFHYFLIIVCLFYLLWSWVSNVWLLSWSMSCLINSTLTLSNALILWLHEFTLLSKWYLVSLSFLIVHVITW